MAACSRSFARTRFSTAASSRKACRTMRSASISARSRRRNARRVSRVDLGELNSNVSLTNYLCNLNSKPADCTSSVALEPNRSRPTVGAATATGGIATTDPIGEMLISPSFCDLSKQSSPDRILPNSAAT